jgi:soluble lytic murein transglycosylase-like protein
LIVSGLLGFLAFKLPLPVVAALPVAASAPQIIENAADVLPAVQPAQGLPGGLAALFTPEVQSWGGQITQWAQEHDLDPNLVATVMQIESCGDPQAVSRSGAMGLFQVMPFHFTAGEDTFAPANNAARGIAYLKKSLEAHGGDVRLALAGYNAGITGSRRPESQWPAETARYVHWGYGIYQDALNGLPASERLTEWLNAGGAGLCADARSRLGQ